MSHTIGKTEKSSTLHKHIRYEVNVFTKGKGAFYCGKTQAEASEGKIFIIPPDTEHQFIHERGSRIYISGEFSNMFNFATPIVISTNPKNEGQILAEMIYNNKYAEKEYLHSLINAFAGFVMQNIKTENEVGKAVKEIVRSISQNFYNCELNVCEILNRSGYSEDYIRAQFKELTGKTPVEFLRDIRISQACFLIDKYKNALSLNEISEKCGYTDYSYFSRCFKKITGVSPREYIGRSK